MTPDPLYADLCARWKQLADVANGIVPTRIPLEPCPGEIKAVADDLMVLARNVDALIESYGAYLDANTPGYFDVSLFKDQLIKAIEGDALYEIEEAAEAVRERMYEAVS